MTIMIDNNLDKLEKEIENNAEKIVKVSPKIRHRVENIISKSNEKNRVALRLNNQTPEMIKRKAQGLPYQTFISSVLHKYANDRLIDEKTILKSISLLTRENNRSFGLRG